MSAIRCLMLVLFAALGGCRDVEGVFEPSCVAFAGDTVTLEDGRFEWDRFTDERRLADDGSVLDPFPDYPRSGDYRVDGDRVEFRVDDGEPVDDRFLVARDGSLYLLDEKQYASLASGGSLPECALKRRGAAR